MLAVVVKLKQIFWLQDKPFWASEKQAVFIASDVFLTLEVLLPPEEGKGKKSFDRTLKVFEKYY